MDMSQSLAQIFGHNAATTQASSEDLEKAANLQFFGELCVSKGIDPSHLNDNQLEELWKVAMEVKAEAVPEKEEPKKEEKREEEEKKAAALAEYNEKRAAHVKVAEADAMGRIMAHSFYEEMKKLAEFPPQFMAKKEEGKEGKEPKKEEKEEKKEKEKEASVQRASELVKVLQQAKTASAPAASTSSTPNFDALAAYRAIDMLKSAGAEPQAAFDRINAVHTLGLQESTKLAAAADADTALTLRAYEYCEAAGFEVDWSKVQ